MIRVFIIVCLIANTLIGCSSNTFPNLPGLYDQDHAPEHTATDKISLQLLEAAKSIEKSIHTLAAVEETINPPLLNTMPLITPEGGLGGTADIDWNGPIAPLLHEISKLSDYRLKVLGKEPPIPVIVSMTKSNAILADILKDAGLQAGKNASIMVFPGSRVIELRYASM